MTNRAPESLLVTALWTSLASECMVWILRCPNHKNS